MLPVVYAHDVVGAIVEGLEHLAIASSEALQVQCFTAVVEALARSLPQAPEPHRSQLADVAARLTSALGDLVLTRALDQRLSHLAEALIVEGFDDQAAAIDKARSQLGSTVGALASRGSRAPVARRSPE